MVERATTYRSIRSRQPHQFAKPDSNHHILYFAAEKNGQETWKTHVTTMLDAAYDAKRGLSVIQRENGSQSRFLMSLSIGEMFEFNDNGGEVFLCVVRQIEQSGRIHYKSHTDARDSSTLKKENLYFSPKKMQALGARKVTVTPLGKIRDAND